MRVLDYPPSRGVFLGLSVAARALYLEHLTRKSHAAEERRRRDAVAWDNMRRRLGTLEDRIEPDPVMWATAKRELLAFFAKHRRKRP